jgi:hypothetical protein
MRLHDIKFQGERIIYSLGLEEAIAQYAGNDPVQSGTAYLGSSYPVRIIRLGSTDFQTLITVSVRIASIRYRGMISLYKVIACRRLGMRMSYLR